MDAARATLAGHLKAAGLDHDTAAGIVAALAAGDADTEAVCAIVGPAATTPALTAAIEAVVPGGGPRGGGGAGGSGAAAPPPPAARPPPPPPPATAPLPAAAPPPPPGGRRGGSLSIKAAKPKASPSDPSAPPRPDRPVTNCLACGRVYDLRAAPRPGSLATITAGPAETYPTGSSPAEVAALIASGGACQAPGCGGRVSLRRGEVVGGDGNGAHAPAVDADADALRARLVAADAAGAAAAGGAPLTSVLDDDGLGTPAEIEANVWLTAAEKEELKGEVAAAVEAAAAARRVQRVTLDLAGRRVVVATPEEGQGGGWGEGPLAAGAGPPPPPPRQVASASTSSADVITALTAALAPWRLEDGAAAGGGGSEDEDGAADPVVGACPTLPIPRPLFGLPARVEPVVGYGWDGGGAGNKEPAPGAFVPGYAPPLSDEEGGGKKGGGGRRKRGGGGKGKGSAG